MSEKECDCRFVLEMVQDYQPHNSQVVLTNENVIRNGKEVDSAKEGEKEEREKAERRFNGMDEFYTKYVRQRDAARARMRKLNRSDSDTFAEKYPAIHAMSGSWFLSQTKDLVNYKKRRDQAENNLDRLTKVSKSSASKVRVRSVHRVGKAKVKHTLRTTARRTVKSRALKKAEWRASCAVAHCALDLQRT